MLDQISVSDALRLQLGGAALHFAQHNAKQADGFTGRNVVVNHHRDAV